MEFINFADLKNGKTVVMRKQFPCKIINISTVKSGKHGHVKKIVTAKDIITDKKYTELFNHSSIISVPIVERREYVISYVDDDGYLFLLDDLGGTREDIKVDNAQRAEIEKLQEKGIVNVRILMVTIEEKEYYKIENLFI